jgi:predicted nucleic acid-binding protein
MKVVLDTNIVIDAVASRQPFCQDAEKILLMISEGKIDGYLTANSITDIFYVVRRNLSEIETREIIRSILYSLNIIEIGSADCWQALSLPMRDFEDALLSSCAEKVSADYIISRDADFANADSLVQIISPLEFLLKNS